MLAVALACMLLLLLLLDDGDVSPGRVSVADGIEVVISSFIVNDEDGIAAISSVFPSSLSSLSLSTLSCPSLRGTRPKLYYKC